MKIIIQTIPHQHQRYNTVGDWFTSDRLEGVVLVSECVDRRFNLLIAVHELIEAVLCTNDGVTEAEVDAFDTQYQGNLEPGDDVRAPYRDQHCFATGIERILAERLGVRWSEYEDYLETLIVSREVKEKNESLSDT